MAPSKHPPVIDFHAHMLEQELLQRAAGKTVLSGYGANPHGGTRAVNETTFQKMLDPRRQIEDMDRRGIDIGVISSATVIQGTSWADPQTDLELNKRCNDRVAEWIATYPDRFVGSLHVAAAGCRSRSRGDAAGSQAIGPAGRESMHQSIEEVKVMASLIYEGVVESFPQLKIVMSHGGGYFPHNVGRMDRNVTNRPDSMQNITRKPSEYLQSFYYDTCLFDPSILVALIQRVGADRLVMGSDYPVGESDPVGFVENCPRISKTDATMMTGGTAARLLGLTTVR